MSPTVDLSDTVHLRQEGPLTLSPLDKDKLTFMLSLLSH